MTVRLTRAMRMALLIEGWVPPIEGLPLTYDSERDVLTVCGIQYAGFMLRGLGGVLELDRWFKVMKREDGVLTITVAPKGARLAWRDYNDQEVKES